jgi:hypothetical protein
MELFKSEDIRKDVKEMMRPLAGIIYNEIYIYIWFICVYNVFLIFLTLANLFVSIRLLRKTYPFATSNE